MNKRAQIFLVSAAIGCGFIAVEWLSTPFWPRWLIEIGAVISLMMVQLSAVKSLHAIQLKLVSESRESESDSAHINVQNNAGRLQIIQARQHAEQMRNIIADAVSGLTTSFSQLHALAHKQENILNEVIKQSMSSQEKVDDDQSDGQVNVGQFAKETSALIEHIVDIFISVSKV